MNLDQITTKCWILALFIRDDGERMLLGDGWYDFKDSLQHFQPNTIASDIVELQGTDGQLLAGQVRRSASQSFDGYVGDAITSRAEIENRRRQFIQFFRTRRHYKVIYIFPDGTAIQRRRGYLTDAPSVPEMWQKFPEYHVALNFEDVNYYEYAEDSHGDEIYAHEAIVNLLKPGTGGLIWDTAGAVSVGPTYSGLETAEGSSLVLENTPEALFDQLDLKGNATQQLLPDGYQAVEFIQSSGTQYIDTGVAVSSAQAWSVKMTVQYTEAPSGSNIMLSPNVNSWFGQRDGYYAIGVNNKSTVQAAEKVDAIVSYTPSTLSLTIGSETISRSLASDTGTLFLFSGGSGNYKSKAKLFGCKIYDNNGAMVRNFVPCYQTSNSAIGLYDLVGGTFYANAGSGSFTKGDDVTISPTPDSPVAVQTVTGENTITITDGDSQSQSYPISLGDNYLAKIPNTDYVDQPVKVDGTWYIRRMVGKAVLDGSETGWSRSQSGTTNLYAYWLLLPNASLPNWNTAELNPKLCDHFTYQRAEWKTVTEPCMCENSGLNPNMCIFSGFDTSDMADVGVWKTWLASNNTTVYYPLAEPVDEEITNETLISQLEALKQAHAYEGRTHIMAIAKSGNAPAILEVGYWTEVDWSEAGYEWEAGSGSSTTTVQVAGVDDAHPIWTVTGPATNPTLTNITTAQTITFVGTVPAGQTLVVDMANQTATLAGANVYQFISGAWVSLSPGANRLTYSAQNAEANSKLQWNGVVG